MTTQEQTTTEIENIKKTVEAHDTTSEELAKETSEETTEKMLEKEMNKTAEAKITEEEKDKKLEKLEEKSQADDRAEKGQSEKRGDKGRRRKRFEPPTREEIISAWEPKTKLGREVKDNKIKNIGEILDNNRKILEPEIVDVLINVKSDLVSIGQSKGKFGGGKRRAWRQTQRKTKEGNVPTFSTLAVIGDGNGHVGIGEGKAKETLPARDKATRKAKLNVIKVKRTCAGFDCACSDLHTVPFKVTGKSGSVKVTLIPASQGTGLVVGNELKKILKLAGIKDVYSQTSGRIRTTFNLIKACMNALEKTNVEDGRR